MQNGNPYFLSLLKSLGYKMPVPEYKFCPDRKFRADYCWVDEKIILEVEGGVWTGGHTRGSMFVKDMEKYNLAAVLGYRIVRVQPKELCKGSTLELLNKLGLK